MKKPSVSPREANRRWNRVLDDLAYLADYRNIAYVLEARWADETGDKDEVEGLVAHIRGGGAVWWLN